MQLVHWPLMGGLLHLIQREGERTGRGHSPPRPILNCCTKCRPNSPPFNSQCTNRRIAVWTSLFTRHL